MHPILQIRHMKSFTANAQDYAAAKTLLLRRSVRASIQRVARERAICGLCMEPLYNTLRDVATQLMLASLTAVVARAKQ